MQKYIKEIVLYNLLASVRPLGAGQGDNTIIDPTEYNCTYVIHVVVSCIRSDPTSNLDAPSYRSVCR